MTDDSIIAQFWERSENAISSTAEKYGRYLMKIAVNILRFPEDAEECVNDTYYTAWKQIPPDHPQKLLPYLGRITRCLALNRYDYLTAQKRNSDFTVQLTELEECLSQPETVESQYESEELSAEISKFLRSLDPEKRRLFVRRYWFSDSIEELASRFRMSESKVKSILFRVRKQLKRHLESEGYQI
ncbi:MAG: sigma-70 family RNA polymerase sigma factor [Lachnospiraceae bacterium]|nr:sigma-70 family RNA polymerase sigma factor [Lachnospiraceae bacterium]